MLTIVRRLIVFSAVVLAHSGSAEARDVLVFFTEGSTHIDQPASDAIWNAAELAKQQHGVGPITVTGFAGTTGTARATALLSATRAQVVLNRLVKDGIPMNRIRMDSKGATAFADLPGQSHRVTIGILVP
jgi:outer membrane protein OmpA-like peptidoglycan-associated protein